MSDVANQIEAVCAAAAERAELAAEHDEQLAGVIEKLRQRLEPNLTRERLESTAALAQELAELVPARLELAAHEAQIIGQIVEVLAVAPARSSSVLRCQATQAQAIASSLRVTAEILDVGAEVERRAASEPARP